jgi:hypothetical protein
MEGPGLPSPLKHSFDLGRGNGPFGERVKPEVVELRIERSAIASDRPKPQGPDSGFALRAMRGRVAVARRDRFQFIHVDGVADHLFERLTGVRPDGERKKFPAHLFAGGVNRHGLSKTKQRSAVVDGPAAGDVLGLDCDD